MLRSLQTLYLLELAMKILDIGAWENVDESRTVPIEHMEVRSFETASWPFYTP